MDLDEILDTFELLDAGEERYRYILELGKGLSGLDDAHKTEANRVHGCQSRVWMIATRDGDHVHFQADSDAFLVRGLIAILLAVYDGRTADEIVHLDPEATFSRIGLEQHLSMGRRNGLHSMVQRVQALAAG